MQRLSISLVAIGLMASVGTAAAQSGYPPAYPDGAQYPSQNDERYYGEGDDTQYDYARVVRVDPVIERGDGYPAAQRPICRTRREDRYYTGDDGGYDGDGDYQGGDDRNDGYGDDGDAGQGGTQAGRSVATVIGGVVGAVLGSRIGGGSGRYATTAVGTMVGGIAGRGVYESNHRQPRSNQVTVCDPMPVSGDARYDDARVSGYDVTYEYAGRRYTTRTDYHPGDRIRVRVDVRPE